jgi:hypothetical protein
VHGGAGYRRTVTVETLRDRYRDAVVAWDEAQAEPARANRLFDRLHDLRKEMRKSDEGRRAIAGLLHRSPLTWR